MKFEIYQSDKNGRWYWRLKASNGRVIGQSAGGKGGGYAKKETAVKMVLGIVNGLLKGGISVTVIEKI